MVLMQWVHVCENNGHSVSNIISKTFINHCGVDMWPGDSHSMPVLSLTSTTNLRLERDGNVGAGGKVSYEVVEFE